jgi:hypothetical protein
MRTWAVLAAFVGTCGLASAQPAAPPAAPAASAYCVSGAGGFLMSEAQGFAEMKKCQRGDTIIIPAASASVVARVCDFTKAIVPSGGNIVCVMQGERGRR